MKKTDEQKTKQVWIKPELTVYGKVEQITEQITKAFGTSDGYTFQGTPIGPPGS